MQEMPDIAVLGAGIVGLSTAVCIQSKLPDSKVTIFAEKFDKETTSDGAAGIFRPTVEKTQAKSFEQLKEWCEVSFAWFDSIYNSEEGPRAGILRLSGYEVMNEKKHFPLHHLMDYSFRELSDDEVKKLPGNYNYGWATSTLMIESRRYLPWLTKRFIANGGKIIQKTIQRISELQYKKLLRVQILFDKTVSPYHDVVVNCLGLACRWLLNDPEVYPVRGHLVRVQAPWIKEYIVVSGGDTYIYPGQDNVILGGTRQEGEYCVDYSKEYFNSILDRCYKLYPSLKHARIVKVWVGLRPHRKTVRVEKQTMTLDGKRIKIVHNYGHGANGIALSWGTAVHAANLTQELLRQKNVTTIDSKSKFTKNKSDRSAEPTDTFMRQGDDSTVELTDKHQRHKILGMFSRKTPTYPIPYPMAPIVPHKRHGMPRGTLVKSIGGHKYVQLKPYCRDWGENSIKLNFLYTTFNTVASCIYE